MKELNDVFLHASRCDHNSPRAALHAVHPMQRWHAHEMKILTVLKSCGVSAQVLFSHRHIQNGYNTQACLPVRSACAWPLKRVATYDKNYTALWKLCSCLPKHDQRATSSLAALATKPIQENLGDVQARMKKPQHHQAHS